MFMCAMIAYDWRNLHIQKIALYAFTYAEFVCECVQVLVYLQVNVHVYEEIASGCKILRM